MCPALQLAEKNLHFTNLNMLIIDWLLQFISPNGVAFGGTTIEFRKKHIFSACYIVTIYVSNFNKFDFIQFNKCSARSNE